MNDYELFVGAAAPNTYNIAPPLYICMGVVPYIISCFSQNKKEEEEEERSIIGFGFQFQARDENCRRETSE